MTAIWQNDESGWHLLSPTGFPNEEKLHTLVEKAPHLLPLAGTPRLIVLGREVQTTLEQDVLNKHLRDRGYKSLAHAVESNDQEGSFNAKPLLQRLCNWAVALEKENLVKLSTYHGKASNLTLLPRLRADNVGLVTIYNNNGAGYLQFWRSVFERHAPRSLARIDQSIMPIKQKKTTREVSNELLDALTDA